MAAWKWLSSVDALKTPKASTLTSLSEHWPGVIAWRIRVVERSDDQVGHDAATDHDGEAAASGR